MSTLTDKLPTVKLPDLKALDLDEAKKPALAAVGVVDLYVAQVKELPAEAKKLQAKIEARRAANTEKLKAVPAQLKALPAEAKKLRVELKGRLEKATAYYGELAVRGEKLVSQIRRQPATEAAIAEGKAAVKKAEAATTSAKKSVKATEQAAEDAAATVG
jgi:chromosome segregation ATPase